MDLINEECVHSVSRRELFEEWLKVGKNERNNHLYSYLSEKCELYDITKDTESRIKNHLAAFSTKVANKWISSGKSKDVFLTKFKTWLDGEDLIFRACKIQSQPSKSSENIKPAGRPRKDFEDSSFKTKKRRIEDLVQSRSVCELLTAAEVASRSAGQRNTAKSIRDISESPQRSNISSGSDNRSIFYRRFREHNTRKCSRIATNRDLISMLLITSDPLINSLREIPKKKVDKLPSEVLKLLVAPTTEEPRHTVVLSESEEDHYFSDSMDESDDD